MERKYNIPLRKEWLKVPYYKRSKKAAKAVREFLARHMKVELENVKIGKWLNQEILKRGRKNPPHHVEVNVIKEGIIARAELKELPRQALEELKRDEDRKKEIDGKKEDKEKAEDKKEEQSEEDKEKEKILKKEVQHEKPVQQHIKQQKVPLKRKALQK